LLVSGIVSRPKYEPFALDPSGRSHLIVADHPAPPGDFGPTPASNAPIEIWCVCTNPRTTAEASQNGRAVSRSFRSTAHLLDQLDKRLARELVGLRIYAVGIESFVWDVARLARKFGMEKGEYRLTHKGSERRRVYCIHCRAYTEDVTTNIVSCSGCGASLLVRDHYSRRLAAFMGVQVDAEVPGDVPAIEEAFP